MTDKEVNVTLNLYEGEATKALYTKLYRKEVNQSAVTVELTHCMGILEPGKEYRFEYQAFTRLSSGTEKQSSIK
jgi:hypothetical protein